MTTKANGLLYRDYLRAGKAAKKLGANAMRVEPNGAISFFYGEELAAPDKAKPPRTPTPSPPSATPKMRLNPEWEKLSNNPERVKLLQESEALYRRMLDMRRDPRQPNGRMITFRQLRENSPEFRQLDKERAALEGKIGPEPPMYLLDADELPKPEREQKLKPHW